MAMSRSFRECGSDEARDDDDDDPDLCSHCATDGKQQPALYFCFNCGVYGRYMCGICLKQHNRFVKNHEIEKIASRSASNRLDYENMKKMEVEKDLKSKEAEVMQLKEKINVYSKENQCHQARIKELEIACKNIEKEKIRGEEIATRNLEHLQNILVDGKKKASDEYKKLLSKQDSLQDRAQENDLKFKSLQHSNEELQKENAALSAELNEIKKDKLSKNLHDCKKAEEANIESKINKEDCERDTKRKESRLVYKEKDNLHIRQREPADGTKRDYNKVIVAAIEIGNKWSGYAFSFCLKYKTDPLSKISVSNWYGRGDFGSAKTHTVVLFNENKKIQSFGFDAEEKYAELADNHEHTTWFFFKHFMMKLSEKRIIRNIEIYDDKGRKMKAIDVFGAVIKYLKDHLLDLLKTRGTEVQNKDIHWVLTVPAIWTDSAKQFMTEAAYSADIAETQLTIVTEPEAAIVYYQTEKQIRQLTTADISSPGTKCMVIDFGGNTTDFTILERQSDVGLLKIKVATGIACGENMVIIEFCKLLRGIIGDAVYQKWIDEYADDQTDLQNEIETRLITIKADSIGKVNLRVPVSLPSILKEINHESTRQAIEKSQYKGRIIWLADKIRIDADMVKNLFKPCTDRIVDHVQHLLKAPDVQGTSIFLMVGKSPIVQEAIIKAFPTVNVIIPKEPDLAVLKGAVIYGHQH